jgi:hypothetical protein
VVEADVTASKPLVAATQILVQSPARVFAPSLNNYLI